ncbi:ATP-binding protein [Candidatus Poribacteria bacterium]|nr:ATP-binding protein [Candidatus Poribacteria bacterium]
MPIGVIFGETSTQEFSFLFGDADGQRQHQLKFAYVELNLPTDNSKIVARVVDVNTENPLLAKDTAKFYSETEAAGISFPDMMSRRFTLYQAKCEVIGRYNIDTKEIEPLTQPINPGTEVELLSDKVLNQLFSVNNQWHLHLGYVETPGQQTQAQVSLRADSIITMHACVFGMTGMGKTTTTATLLEELMFRGAKTIVFDPHSDYVNLNRIRQEFYDQFFREKVESDDEVKGKISEYKELLRKVEPAQVPPWNTFDPSFGNLVDEATNEELTSENIFYRLLNFCAIREPHLMIDSKRDPEELNSQLGAVINGIKQLDLQNHLPEELVRRKLTIKFNAFPTIRLYEDKSPYFTMRLIEAIAGEGFTEAQEGYVIDWLRGLTDQNLEDGALFQFLRGRIRSLSAGNYSRVPLTRIVSKAQATLGSLVQRGCQSLDISNFVNAFCPKDGDLSEVSTAIFDLSDLENNHARRALIYAIMDFIFDEYKSKRLAMDKNAHPVLFALEEARTLIPRQEESSTSGEMHPATRAARLAARQIATEGRKMGLGMLVISQKPASVDPLTVSQANTLILHRVINPDDQTYIRNVGESLASEDLETLKMVKEGVAIVTGDALKTRMSTLVKVRNRYSEPGTEKPTPIQDIWEGKA